MVRIAIADTEPQDTQMHNCLEISRTEVSTKCWYCGCAVLGTPLQNKPGRYRMACTNCDYSTREAFSDYRLFRRIEEGAEQ
jgi:hypothetical protein